MAKKYKIQVPVNVVKRTKYWIAYCPVLKTYGYSEKNQEGALVDFDKAIKTFFHVQEKFGTLHQTLLTLGWTWEAKGKVKAPHYSNADIPPYRNAESQQQREVLVPA